MKTLDQIIQEQVDYIMDSFDFKSASEALRCVEHCWINQLEMMKIESLNCANMLESVWRTLLKEPRRIQMGWDCVALVA
jgi:hypothetical protein